MAASPDPHTATVFYKVLTNDEFATVCALGSAPFAGTAFDQSVSPAAIHLASSLHTPEVLKMRFADQESVWVLAIPRTPRLDAGLDWFKVDGSEEWSMRFVGSIDPLNEVSVRRPVKQVKGEWDLGELVW